MGPVLMLAMIAEPVFVDVDGAAEMLELGAIVLDARGEPEAPFLPGAQPVDWKDYRDGWFRTGKLDDDEAALRRAFERKGVDDGRPVLVVGGMASGWGEEGRIWWTLRYLGHRDVRILDGGVAAWVAARRPTEKSVQPVRGPGHLTSATVPDLRVELAGVDAAIASGAAQILDTRRREEFEGATPYHASRGGRVPGARHLYWKDLVGGDGRLLPKSKLREALAGLDPKAETIAYCTGGVRSAFVVAVLRHLGFERAKNYDGSWWEWAKER